MSIKLELSVPLAEHQIHLWQADLRIWGPYSGLFLSSLSIPERDRHKRLKIPAKQEQFLVSRGLLRLILSAYLGNEPQELVLKTSSAGKPELENEEISFNLSHSGEMLLFAFRTAGKIGLDLQEIYQITNLEKVIQKTFNLSEQEHLACRGSKSDDFFKFWVAKEAFLKAEGIGLQAAGNRWSIQPSQSSPGNFQVSTAAGILKGWMIREIQVGEGYQAALAAEGRVDQILHFPLEMRLDPQKGDLRPG